jgi:neurotransmitter:Na+ symporter, NSS family
MGNKRGRFSGRLGFVAAAAGSAVGLGNIWRFPYETGENGGAAFLLIYLIFTIVIGLPVMLGEIAVGRKSQMDAYGSYRTLGNKNWGIVGAFGIICGIMILSFYNVVAGWAFGYFIQIVFNGLLSEGKGDYGNYFSAYVADFWDNLIFSFVFMVLTSFIVIRGIKEGIETASKILMPLLFVILITLIVYALTLDNAMEGVKFYLLPDFSEISASTIYSALGQAFFSLSLGMGALITYGSYLKKKENLLKAAAVVTFADVSVAFLAGLLIFPLVFSQGQQPTAGPGLVFVALPTIFEQMGPLMGRFVGGSFFLLLCFAALTSTISLLEVPVAYLVDERKLKRKKVVFVLAALVFVIGLPSMLSAGAVDLFTNFMHYEGKDKSFLDVISDLFSEVGLVFGGFMLTLFITFKWKTKKLTKELSEGSNGYSKSILKTLINFSITLLSPILLGVIFVITVLQKFFGVSLF